MKNMRRTVLSACLILGLSLGQCLASPAEVLLGDEQFAEYLPLLEGKRTALFTNHTGIVGDQTFEEADSASGIAGSEAAESLSGNNESADRTSLREDGALDVDRHFGLDASGEELIYGQHILDALLERGVNVTAVFSPEHGFRGTGDAGAAVDSSVDEKTGVPILSLYEDDRTHSPASEDMEKFDVLLVDMQDVGLRYYTYYISLFYLMDACAGNGKEVIILDRPNPNGFYVDGPILQEGFRSGVGQIPIPAVHGMTWGELGRMINGEGWLRAGVNACDLTVIPCRNYNHQMKTSLIRSPSPNIKDMRAVYLYASTCYFENTRVSVGRGTDFPFEFYGSPYLEGIEGFDFCFTPRSMSGALSPPFMGEVCYGEDLRSVPVEEIWEAGVNPDYLIRAYQAYAKTRQQDSFWGKTDMLGRYWIDLLSGSARLRNMVEAGKTAEEIKAAWREDIEAFKVQRAPYLLYEE